MSSIEAPLNIKSIIRSHIFLMSLESLIRLLIYNLPPVDQLSLQDGHPRRFRLPDVRDVGQAGDALVLLQRGLGDDEAAEAAVPEARDLPLVADVLHVLPEVEVSWTYDSKHFK